MKKLNFLFAVMLIAIVPFFTSCGTDGELTDTKPSINFVGGAGFTSADISLKSGQPLKIGINASSNTGSNTKLAKFKVVRTFNNVPFTALDSTLSSTNVFNITIESFAHPQAGTERWTFTITDKDGQSSELSFVVTTTAGGPIKTHSQKILGSYDNAAGSSFASADGIVYSLADAKTNSAKVDWMYYYGNSNDATLAAPSDASVATVFTDATNGPAKWGVRNSTKLGKVTLPSGVTFDNIANDTEIIPLATGITDTKVTKLTVGQIVAFKTAAGKMGIIKVEAITGTTGAGSITYSVKVQQ